MRLNYNDFEVWSKAAKEDGLRIKKVTVSNTNTYYQAIHREDGIRGFFNTCVGKVGDHEHHTPHGQLTREDK